MLCPNLSKSSVSYFVNMFGQGRDSSYRLCHFDLCCTEHNSQNLFVILVILLDLEKNLNENNLILCFSKCCIMPFGLRARWEDCCAWIDLENSVEGQNCPEFLIRSNSMTCCYWKVYAIDDDLDDQYRQNWNILILKIKLLGSNSSHRKATNDILTLKSIK